MIFYNPKYILPTGSEWKGPVHQLPNGDWMTGKEHNSASLPVVKVDEAWTFPKKGQIASQKVIEQLFSYLEKDSASVESLLKSFNAKVSSIKSLISNAEIKINSALEKVKDHLDSKTIQSELAGRGSLFLSDLNLSLEETSSKDRTSRIYKGQYVHANDDNYFLWTGNIEAGLLYNESSDQNNVLEAIKRKLIVEMVSRTGAYTEEIDEANILLNKDYALGFNGKFVFTLKVPTKITYIKLDNNAGITEVIINEGTDTEKVYPIGEPFDPVSASTITLKVENLIEPVPFTTYFSKNLKDDYLGEGKVTTGTKAPKIYQRTRLELGKLGISLKNFKPTRTIVLGENSPFTCTSGTLSSLNFIADEKLANSTPDDSAFKYYLIINNKEYRIYPLRRAGNNIHTYRINSGLSDEARSQVSSNIGFIDTETPPVSWKLKVILNESDNTEASPVLKRIKFNYLTSLSGGINV